MDMEKLSYFQKKFSHRVKDEHLFKGTLMHSGFLEDVHRDKYNDFKLHKDDVILCTYPKSGTTWVQEITWLLLNKGDIEKAKERPLMERFPFFDVHAQLQSLESAPSPRLMKTHLPANIVSDIWQPDDENSAKIIYVARNPKDVSVSYYHFYQANVNLGNFAGSWNEWFEMFVDGYVCSNNWFDNVLPWYDVSKRSKRVLFLKYEDLLQDIKGQVMKIQSFLGVSLADVAIDKIIHHTQFDQMKNNKMTNYSELHPFWINLDISPFQRKGQIGDWQNYYTAEQDQRFMSMYREKMKGTDLSFQFLPV